MRRLLFLTVLVLSLQLVGQQRKIDSLNALLQSGQHDTLRFKRMVKLLFAYKKVNLNKAIETAKSLQALSAGLDEKRQADADYYCAMLMYNQGEVTEALELSLKCAGVYRKLGLKKDLAQTFNQIGGIYLLQSKHQEALRYYQLSVKLKEELGDRDGLANSLGNIGLIHQSMSNYSMAVVYFKRSAQIKREINDMLGYAKCLVNLPAAYNRMNNYSESIAVLQTALRIADSLEDLTIKGAALANLSEAYLFTRDYRQAEKYISACLQVREALADSNDLCFTYITMGSIFSDQEKHRRAVDCGLKAKTIAEHYGWNVMRYDAYGVLATAYYGMKDFKSSADYLFKLKAVGDSIYNEQNTKSINEIEGRYQLEKKNTELRLNSEKLRNQQLEIERQNTVKFVFAGGFGLAVLVMLIVYRSYRQKKEANRIISEQKNFVEQQRQMLEVKNNEIMDSIRYAKRIQQALLPNEAYLDKKLRKQQK